MKLNNKGMTLTELLAGMMIFAVIAGCVTAIMSPILRTYHAANDLAEANTLFDSLSAELLSDLTEASAVNITGTGVTITRAGGSGIEYTVDSGILKRGTQQVLAPSYYKNKTINIEYYAPDGTTPISGSPPSAFLVRFTLYNSDGGTMATREYAARPPALQ